ncbi:hypothetical protein SAMN04487897_12148 [Paenibacillus sp. yr247]|uniref:hypothetical protein n=1 Tax=Paenibacillus sp. yr247 TaxID=1761880 RepID=UPI00088647F3|nr:hypothetical protein [Paenibacillus sp. yr247]SDO75663.1 hypothetical protein SAMN04487897_12148 [Paenibacillus sp. yr247]
MKRKWEITPWTNEWKHQYEIELKALKVILIFLEHITYIFIKMEIQKYLLTWIIKAYLLAQYQQEKEKKMDKLIEEALRWGERRRNQLLN